jgi:hypothetical protein
MMKRKLFFGDCQVLRAKIRVYGKALPPNEVLVKLRAPGQPPKWVRMERSEFDRGKHIRAIRNLDQTKSWNGLGVIHSRPE